LKENDTFLFLMKILTTNQNPFTGVCWPRRRCRLLQERDRGPGERPVVDDDRLGDRGDFLRRRAAGQTSTFVTLLKEGV